MYIHRPTREIHRVGCVQLTCIHIYIYSYRPTSEIRRAGCAQLIHIYTYIHTYIGLPVKYTGLAVLVALHIHVSLDMHVKKNCQSNLPVEYAGLAALSALYRHVSLETHVKRNRIYMKKKKTDKVIYQWNTMGWLRSARSH